MAIVSGERNEQHGYRDRDTSDCYLQCGSFTLGQR